MADGGWRMADGGWRMADGGWRMADGGWRMAHKNPFVVEKKAGYKKFWFMVERMLSGLDKSIEK
jgi:hypothetical protein